MYVYHTHVYLLVCSFREFRLVDGDSLAPLQFLLVLCKDRPIFDGSCCWDCPIIRATQKIAAVHDALHVLLKALSAGKSHSHDVPAGIVIDSIDSWIVPQTVRPHLGFLRQELRRLCTGHCVIQVTLTAHKLPCVMSMCISTAQARQSSLA